MNNIFKYSDYEKIINILSYSDADLFYHKALEAFDCKDEVLTEDSNVYKFINMFMNIDKNNELYKNIFYVTILGLKNNTLDIRDCISFLNENDYTLEDFLNFLLTYDSFKRELLKIEGYKQLQKISHNSNNLFSIINNYLSEKNIYVSNKNFKKFLVSPKMNLIFTNENSFRNIRDANKEYDLLLKDISANKIDTSSIKNEILKANIDNFIEGLYTERYLMKDFNNKITYSLDISKDTLLNYIYLNFYASAGEEIIELEKNKNSLAISVDKLIDFMINIGVKEFSKIDDSTFKKILEYLYNFLIEDSLSVNNFIMLDFIKFILTKMYPEVDNTYFSDLINCFKVFRLFFIKTLECYNILKEDKRFEGSDF